MSERTIHEIEARYSEEAAGILKGWYDTRDEIARSPGSIEGPYTDHLTDEGRAEAVRQQKSEKANAERENYIHEYQELTEERNEQVKSRRGFLSERLFKVEDDGALARAALATDTELGTLLEIAAQTGNAELGRAAFVAAEQRGLGELMGMYLDRIDPEARELYEEFKAAPTDDAMTRKLADAETMFSPPDSSRFATAPTFRVF